VRTLVVHFGGIGDFLLTCPSIARLKEDGPVEILGQPSRIALAVLGGIADAVHDHEKNEWHSVFVEPTEKLTLLLRTFDRAVVWMRDDGQIARRLAECGIPEVRVFPGLPPDGWNRHASQYYSECLGMNSTASLVLEVRPTAPGHDVILAPGSGGAHKNWPLDRFMDLASCLQQDGRHVDWVLGPAEGSVRLPEPASALPTMPLTDLAGMLASARLHVGNDSGISHLAAAVGCPTVAIFGPTDPAVWGPMGSHVVCLKGSPWPGVVDVLEAAKRIEPRR